MTKVFWMRPQLFNTFVLVGFAFEKREAWSLELISKL